MSEENPKERKVRIYSKIEFPGSTVSEQIELMKKLGIWSPDVENILKWHPQDCPDCGRKYFPSGSLEIRCHSCQVKFRRKYKRDWIRKYRENH